MSVNTPHNLIDEFISKVDIDEQKKLIQVKNYLSKLEEQKKENDIKLFMQQEKIEYLESEIKDYDEIFGFSEEMSLKEKKKQNDKMNKEEKNILKSSDKSVQEQYEKDMQDADDMVDLSLHQQSMHYEIHEIFENIKQNIQVDKKAKFKQAKVDFYKCIDIFNNVINEDYAENLFSDLEEVIDLFKSIYEIDRKLQNLS